jgi:hypothetical protein
LQAAQQQADAGQEQQPDADLLLSWLNEPQQQQPDSGGCLQQLLPLLSAAQAPLDDGCRPEARRGRRLSHLQQPRAVAEPLNITAAVSALMTAPLTTRCVVCGVGAC